MSNEKLLDVFAQWSAVRAQRKELEEQEAALKQVLSTLIPEGATKAGIKHTVQATSSVQYKNVLDRVKQELVPKSKHGVIETIVDAFTTRSVRHSFEKDA